MRPTYHPPKLPTFLGVHSLSKAEIKKDFSEIIPKVDTPNDKLSDSDSEICSVDSKDICASDVYPVPPRVTPKFINRNRPQAVNDLAYHQNKHSNISREKVVVNSDLNNEQVIETLELLKLMEKVKPELFETEKSRERLETQYQV